MRLLLTAVVFAMAFAGCVGTEAPDPLFGVCPQWLDGDVEEATLRAGESRTFTAGHEDASGRALDLWTITIDASGVSGTVELRAQADDGRSLRFTDYRDPANPRTPTILAVNAESGMVAVDVFLSDVTHGAEADPSGIQLSVTGQGSASGSVQLTLTPAYRVCGAPLPAE